MTPRRFEKRPSLEALVHRVDRQRPGDLGGDTVPTGFPSVDKLLGGGLRRSDLIMLGDRKSTRLNSSHGYISYAVFCLKKKKKQDMTQRTNMHVGGVTAC